MANDTPGSSSALSQPQEPTLVDQPRVDQAAPTVQSPEKQEHVQSQSYFNNPFQPSDSTEPRSPVEVARGARSGAELLRRLSLIDPARVEAFDYDPRVTHPGLKLSGNIISATICLPYQFGHRPGGEWKVNPRRGTSALFDNFAFLASDKTPWNHTLVGWTGEV